MDIWRLLRVAMRRWYILLPTLALTGAATWLARDLNAPEYQTEGTVLITQDAIVFEEDASGTVVENPFGDLDVTAVVLQYSMNSSGTRELIAEQGLSPSYEVEAQSRSPILGVEVRAGSPEQAIATGRALIEAIGRELVARQEAAGVPAGRLIGTDVLDEPDSVLASTDGQVQETAAVAAVGLALSFGLAILVDNLALLRRRDDRAGLVAESGNVNPRSTGGFSNGKAQVADYAPGQRASDDTARTRSDSASDMAKRLRDRLNSSQSIR